MGITWHLVQRGISFSVPELVTPLSPSGGILVSCAVVLHLESPPPSGCGASFESFVVSWAGLPRAQCTLENYWQIY